MASVTVLPTCIRLLILFCVTRNDVVIDHDLRPAMIASHWPVSGDAMGMVSQSTVILFDLVIAISANVPPMLEYTSI